MFKDAQVRKSICDAKEKRSLPLRCIVLFSHFFPRDALKDMCPVVIRGFHVFFLMAPASFAQNISMLVLAASGIFEVCLFLEGL